MQKRSEVNKEIKLQNRIRLKRTVLIILCLVFAYSAIYVADISNKIMLNKQNEDRYALRVNLEKDDRLRIDLAGTKHYYDVSKVMLYINRFTDKAKGLMVQLQTESENYLKRSRQGKDM